MSFTAPHPARSNAREALAAVLGCLLALGAALPAGAQEIRSLQVSQVHQVRTAVPTVRAYLDVRDERGQPAEVLGPSTLSATLGDKPLRLERLEPMRGSGEGVAYVFLVDVSRSLSTTEFARIVEQIEAWIAGLARADRAAIIAFGEQVRLAVDFTSNKEDLANALWALGPTDDLTLFHRALVEALELAQRRDPDLPGRRALIVLTDGRDEGSGLAVDDVLATLRANPAPLYAIGHSRLRDPAERQRYLDLLARFATVSGGVSFEAETTEFEEAYAAIRDAVHSVWLAEFSCRQCPADGREVRFQATVASEGRILSDGMGVRVFATGGAAPPPASRPAAEPAVGPAVGPDAQPEASATAPDQPEAGGSPERPLWKRLWFWPAVVLVLLLAAIARRLVFGPRRKPQASSAEADGDRPEDPEADAGSESDDREEEPPGGIDQPLPAPRAAQPQIPASPLPLRGLRLIVVRGSKAGRQYRLILQDRAVVGARSDCDCVLASEPNVAPEQFELVQQAGRVYIRNLAQDRPTLLDGFAIDALQPIDSNALIGNGDLILRVVLD